MRDSWRALWSSRLLVWAAGVGTVLAVRLRPDRAAFDPPGLTRGLGGARRRAGGAGGAVGLRLVPADRPLRLPPGLGAYTVSRSAFFPLYPLGLG